MNIHGEQLTMRRLKAATLRAALSTFCSFILLTTAHARADETAARAFDISPQSLATALSEFARQSQQEILFAPEVVAQKLSSGVRGTMPPLAALKLLLRGSSLTFTTTTNGAVLVGALPSGGATPLSSGDEKVVPKVSGEDASEEKHSPEGALQKNRDNRIRMAQEDKGVTASDSLVRQQEDQSSKKKASELEEIVVTAEKREERLQNVPISMSVLTGNDLDKSTAQGVDEMLNRVPGVVVATPSVFGTQVEIRGVAAGGVYLDSSSPIAYYLDSVPFGFVRSAFAPDSNPYDLQRVEVLRGPQGTLYGANAEAGVVRVLTNDADLNDLDFKARTSLSATDGAGGGNYAGDAAVNVPIIPGALAVRAVVDYQDLSGWIDRPNDKHANDAKLRTYRLKINAQPTNELSVGLSAWSSRDHYGAPSTSDDTGHAPGLYPEPITHNYDAYGLKVIYQFSQFSVSSMTSYLAYKNDFTLDLTPLVPLPLYGAAPSRVFSQEVILNSTDSSSWRWSAGGFYRDAKDEWFQNINGNSSTDLAWADGSKSYAIFGELSRRVLDEKLEWTLGLRQFHDDVSTVKTVQTPPPSDIRQSFNATTPRAVLTWFPHNDLTVYGSFSEGFRSGMPQYYSVSQSAPSIPAVKPDRLYNYEIGAKGNLLDKRVSFDAAFFYIDWRDVQQSITVPYPGNQGGFITAQVNGQSASGPGVEFSVNARPINALVLGATFSWNDLRFDKTVYSGGVILFNSGDRLDFSSEYTGSAFSDYTFPIGGFTGQLSASANYQSKQSYRNITGTVYQTNGNDLTFARTSVSLRSSDHWSATVYADNLTNEHGAWPAQNAVPGWFPRPRPRTVGVQLEYHYK